METNLKNNKNICLILLIGIPGCGKTYLTNFLVNHLSKNMFSSNSKYFSNLCVIPVSYDDYISYHTDSNVMSWKQRRTDVFIGVEEFILYFKGYKNSLNSKLYVNNNYCTDNKDNMFIIIDDNMYYKSMRYEYYKLARKYEISFCQIYLEASLDKALEYNKKRDGVSIVPEQIIIKMNELIEKPNTSNNSWEQHSLTIPAFINFDEYLVLNQLYNIILSALESPVKDVIITSYENYEESKRITNCNLVHQVDVKLRNIIGNYIKQVKHNNSQIRYIADCVNNKRVQLLKDLKSGIFTVPPNIISLLLSSSRSDEHNKCLNNYFLDILTNDIYCDK
ncbi:phosphoseryl tRNA kinase [Lycorma delicatula]|uniref:phosphoseryl tRNA kinase n=1 Tax=Lycorma delicatula TaxID=130591 RepID=UPI003F5125AA